MTLEEENARLAAQVAALREALETVRFQLGGDSDKPAEDESSLEYNTRNALRVIKPILSDTARAAAEHDERVRREALASEKCDDCRENDAGIRVCTGCWEKSKARVRREALEEAAIEAYRSGSTLGALNIRALAAESKDGEP